jgi:hypothetical protein
MAVTAEAACATVGQREHMARVAAVAAAVATDAPAAAPATGFAPPPRPPPISRPPPRAPPVSRLARAAGPAPAMPSVSRRPARRAQQGDSAGNHRPGSNSGKQGRSTIKTRNRDSNPIRNPIESPRENSHMQAAWQVGQCGNQETHAEVLCRRRRAVHAIATKAFSPQ